MIEAASSAMAQRRRHDHALAGGIAAAVVGPVWHIGGDLLDDLARGRLVEAEPLRQSIQASHHALDRNRASHVLDHALSILRTRCQRRLRELPGARSMLIASQ